MRMKKIEPRNTTIYVVDKNIDAELYFQTGFCDHIMQNRIADNQKRTANPKEVSHDLTFADIRLLLSGNVHMELVDKRYGKYKILNRFRGKLYRGFFYLSKRTDCPGTWFAVISTAYITLEKIDKMTYANYIEKNRELFG